MAEVDLEIGGRRYVVACREGEEDHFHRLAAVIDARMKQASDAVGGLNEVRQFLFAALLLADELEEARGGGAASPSATPRMAASTDPAIVDAIERIAGQLEALADSAGGGVEAARAAS